MDVALTCSECWTWLRSWLQDQAANGDGGSMPATALQHTRSLTWLDCWVHNSPFPDLVDFLASETHIMVMVAGIQAGTVTIVTADCREETVLLKKKRLEKDGKKGWKEHIQCSTSLG